MGSSVGVSFCESRMRIKDIVEDLVLERYLLFCKLVGRRKRIKEVIEISWDRYEGDWGGFFLVGEIFGIRRDRRERGLCLGLV